MGFTNERVEVLHLVDAGLAPALALDNRLDLSAQRTEVLGLLRCEVVECMCERLRRRLAARADRNASRLLTIPVV